MTAGSLALKVGRRMPYDIGGNAGRPTSILAIGFAVVMSLCAFESRAGADSLYEVDGAINLNYTNQTGTADSNNRVFTDVRPGIVYQTMSDRVVWRFGYVFSGLLDIGGTGTSSYSNHADIAMIAQLDRRTGMTLTFGFTQGGTSFQQTQPTGDMGQPQLRNPTNPNLVNGSFAEAVVHEASPDLRFYQTLSAAFSTPQDDLDQWNLTMNGPLGFEHLFPNNAIGLELRPSFSFLHPLDGSSVDGYVNLTNAIVARWNHDFSPRWNALATAGVEQVITFTGSEPLAFLPTGSLTATYLFGEKVAGAFNYSHGAQTDIQTGTVAASDIVTVRGTYTFGQSAFPRVFSASAGFLHSSPIGQAKTLIASGTGDAAQVDAQVQWFLSDTVVATGRYSLAYQFDQGAGIAPSLAQVVLVGITARYTNQRVGPRFPGISGQRVDGADAAGFPDSEKPRR